MAFKHLAAFVALFLAFGLTSPVRAEQVQIVGFGDSLTAGFGLAPGEGFTDLEGYLVMINRRP